MTFQVYLPDPKVPARIDVAFGRWVRRIAVAVMRFLDLRHQAEAFHVRRYEGCSWCESTERAMLADIAGRNARR